MVILYLTVYLELVRKQLELSVSCLGRHCMLEKEKDVNKEICFHWRKALRVKSVLKYCYKKSNASN